MTCTSSDYGENIVQSSKKISIKLYEELCSRGTHCLYIEGEKKISIKLYEELCSRGNHCLYIEGEKWLSSQCGKKNLTITSKLHAHPHTMKKMHAKVNNNQYKTVRGAVLTTGTNC